MNWIFRLMLNSLAEMNTIIYSNVSVTDLDFEWVCFEF